LNIIKRRYLDIYVDR